MSSQNNIPRVSKRHSNRSTPSLDQGKRGVSASRSLHETPLNHDTRQLDTEPGPTAQLMTVTPELASRWLDTNTMNRSVRDRLVRKLSGAILRGEWAVNGDTIRFDPHGNLIDGQHRLLAIAEADTPVQTFVATGIARDAQVTMDTGAKRQFNDVLKMRGESFPVGLASTVRLYWRYENGTLRYNREEPSFEEMMTLLEDYPDMRESVQAAQHTNTKTTRWAATVTGVAHFLLSEIDPDKAEWFFDRIRDGVGLEEDSGIRRMREWLGNVRATGDKKPESAQTLALYIKAWNAYIEGRPVKILRWRGGGSNPEPFPVPKHPDS